MLLAEGEDLYAVMGKNTPTVGRGLTPSDTKVSAWTGALILACPRPSSIELFCTHQSDARRNDSIRSESSDRPHGPRRIGGRSERHEVGQGAVSKMLGGGATRLGRRCHYVWFRALVHIGSHCG
jgi:hypothetical protein